MRFLGRAVRGAIAQSVHDDEMDNRVPASSGPVVRYAAAEWLGDTDIRRTKQAHGRCHRGQVSCSKSSKDGGRYAEWHWRRGTDETGA